MCPDSNTVIDAGADLRIPVIDLGPYRAGDPAGREAAAEQLRQASESVGFYFIANHGVPQPLIDRVFAEAERFHHLPLERKLAVRAIDDPIGYLPVGGQTQRAELYGARSKHPDRSASYYIREEFAPDHPDRLAKKPWVFDNRWPADLPGFRETLLEYFATLSALMREILPLQSMALGLGPDFLPSHDAFKPMNPTLRLIHYPPRIPENDGQYGIGPHTDFGYTTILARPRSPVSKSSAARANGSAHRPMTGSCSSTIRTCCSAGRMTGSARRRIASSTSKAMSGCRSRSSSRRAGT